jgi:hypothetical protein
MHKSATKCNETLGKWCKNKQGASKIIDTFETYHTTVPASGEGSSLEAGASTMGAVPVFLSVFRCHCKRNEKKRLRVSRKKRRK